MTKKKPHLTEKKTWTEEDVAELKASISELRQQVLGLKEEKLELEVTVAVLREAEKLIKKDQSVSIENLKNSEKAVIVDALRKEYSLPLLLRTVQIARSSYYYQLSNMNKPPKYHETAEKITEIFHANRECYGYRRIKHELDKDENRNVSEKVIRRLMKQQGLSVPIKRRRKYNSYKGEITPAVSNIINRDFSADKPNEKWLTDITEFSIPAGKVYLSPAIDCFDGMPVAWTIGTSPNAALVNEMLDKATAKLREGEHPIVHSDRGCHYRWPGWIDRMEKAGLTRSMSKKGCSPDNSACEGFFGHLKNEMFYNRNWNNVTIDQFIQTLDDYILWYNEKRIKSSLGYMSPADYRRKLDLPR